MSGIRSNVGLVSGINSGDLIESLIQLQRAPVVRMERRIQGFQATETGLKALEAAIVSIAAAVQGLGRAANFQAFSVKNTAEGQIRVTAGEKAAAGTYAFQAVRRATAHEVVSRGFANADQQPVGAGSLTISNGGGLHRSTLLDALNGGNGIRRGVIRLTDSAGNAADIDLANAYTVDDVLHAINANAAVSVTASTRDGRLVLTDTSGGGGSLTVADLNGGHAARDLGIAGSAADNELTGDSVFEITADFTLDQINDGNGLRLFQGAPDIRVTLSDDTTFEVNLDGVATLGEILGRINNHEDNNGKVAAALVDGRLVLSDLSGGGGAGVFAVEDVNDAAVVRQLGLDVAADNDEIAGLRLAAGLNSVLLRNLRGGEGIDQIGELTLTDRTGTTATIDLAGAQSLDEVIHAINAAESAGEVKLQLTARLNDAGNGIVIVDTSGSAASNLVVADVGGSTLAAQLGIAVDAAQDAINSGTLRHRYVNQATGLDGYAPSGGGPRAGSILIVDSAGNEAAVSISTAVKTVGDVLQRINAAAGVSVRAELNETGDGFVLIDEAGGAGTLRVQELGGHTAADLRLLGDSVVGGDGKQRVVSRNAVVIDVAAGETLNDLKQKINAASGFVNASVFDDGSAFNSTRLSLQATKAGSAGRLIIDSALDSLNLGTRTTGQDALLRVGGDPASGFLVASASNTFQKVFAGLDVEVLRPDAQPADVTVQRDTAKIESTIQAFVTAYNTFITSAADLTKFDVASNTRGSLQGQSIVQRVQGRLDGLVTRRFFGPDQPVRSLLDVGIRMGTGGRLVFDKERLHATLNQNPQAVSDFFLDKDSGFAARAKTTVESLTDPFTGTFALEQNSLKNSVESLERRIAQLDAILEVRRDRLLRQFSSMENALSILTTQQQSLGEIQRLRVPSQQQS